ncbi:Electron transfer flavoprotein alpha/beta-subunit [Caldalkalibacillus thermarum TA2.A1]|uniref:Electron transfer flavoprotein alpha/beta-subunit n=1 Tax=Caldalkalibacillus thermarum (strain TA2.A1) TaxID=986075 RepID=F5L5Y7_CALTT|nr:electron transfer flavoprotein subunit alpha/FixB family protein [Caldalkalibacillus thermarum]EGL83260.1 Electron transfer flavoprotein alpha/beta-subunit [Caldalkalibacillus thermarum TA2.A1]QZT33620.1 electron transfer flavoprotein subunit alpha/FixB family protein [Caldalkalibacillus thermarum TA2.A1]
MGKHILVLAETKGGALRNVSLEAIAAARQISGDGQVTAAVFGPDGDQYAEELIQHGADKVVLVKHEELKQYTTDGYRQALLQVIDQLNPDGVLLGHTSQGKDVSPRIAAKLGAGLISDVTAIELDGDTPLFVRPIYSGKAFAKKKIKDGLIVATIRPNNIKPLEKDTTRITEVEELQVEIKDLRTVVKEVVSKTAGTVDLAEASIIVSGGRGVKSAEGFKPLYELAEVLGGAVGASRGACDAGYCDYALQIGQTGKVVTPDLYIACGISGAIQHLAGMSNSKVIVAINKDPEAEIFKVADYGIVGDLFEVVPKLTEEFKKVLAKA